MDLKENDAVPPQKEALQKANTLNAHGAQCFCQAAGFAHALLRALNLCFCPKAENSRAELKAESCACRRA